MENINIFGETVSAIIREMRCSAEIYKTRKAMGESAGKKAEEFILQSLKQKKEVRIIAAAAGRMFNFYNRS